MYQQVVVSEQAKADKYSSFKAKATVKAVNTIAVVRVVLAGILTLFLIEKNRAGAKIKLPTINIRSQIRCIILLLLGTKA